jgi:hypothetical protein
MPAAARHVAAPLVKVAELLQQPLCVVQAAGERVEPYYTLDGEPKWSVHLVGVALGLRRCRAERTRKRNQHQQACATA